MGTTEPTPRPDELHAAYAALLEREAELRAAYEALLLSDTEHQRQAARDLARQQRREAQQSARFRVREQVWKMRTADDITHVLEAVGDSLRSVEVPFLYCGVSTIVSENPVPLVSGYVIEKGGEWVSSGEYENPTVVRMWQEGKTAYRRDITEDDPYGEYIRLADERSKADHEIVEIRAILDVPFSHGTLAVSSPEPDAFSDADVEALESMAGLLSEGYRRMDDLQALDDRRLELEREVEERRQAETRLQLAKEEAEEANRAKSTFLANMSHELRTPLNAILGYAQLLQHDAEVSGEAGASLETIHSSGEHLLELIDSVLDMSRIEAGQTTVEASDFDLPVFLQTLTAMFRLRARQRGLQLTFQADDGLPRFVRADEGKLRQILINLLGNAVKFTETGSVTVRAGVGDGGLQIEVEDTGPGISEEEQAVLFEAFVQARAGQRSRGGTGLGLAISRQYAQIMGGELDVRSEPGVGSVFTLRIPVEEVEAIPDPQGEARGRVVGLQPGQEEVRVLIAEDVEANRRLMVSLLQPVGLVVREAADGQEALEICREWQPHLVWMDMHMPAVDGYEATRRIKAGDGAIPVVIALTASAFEEDRDRVMAAGCDDFLRKPFREEEIFAAMERHLALRYVFEETEPREAGPAGGEEGTADVSRLPAAWRQRLHEAAREADDEALLALLDGLQGADAEAARGLRPLAAEFRFDEIMRLVEG